MLQHEANKITADKPAAAGDEKTHSQSSNKAGRDGAMGKNSQRDRLLTCPWVKTAAASRQFALGVGIAIDLGSNDDTRCGGASHSPKERRRSRMRRPSCSQPPHSCVSFDDFSQFPQSALNNFLASRIAPEVTEFGEIKMTGQDVLAWMQKARTARQARDRGDAIANLQNCA
jgi:hypothetical protein